MANENDIHQGWIQGGCVGWIATPSPRTSHQKNIIPEKIEKNGNTWIAKTLRCQPAFVLPKSPLFGTNIGQLKIN